MRLKEVGTAIILSVSAYFLWAIVPSEIPLYARIGVFGVETYMLGK